MAIGIICAMNSELEVLKETLKLKEVESNSPWSLYESDDKKIIAVVCGVGKVSAAAGLSYMLSNHKVDKLIGIGVAGGIAEDLKMGDVVICTGAVQHDMDVTAFGYELGMIPGIRMKEFMADPGLVTKAAEVAQSTGLKVNIRTGLVLSGDKFVANAEGSRLRQTFMGDCVDMETAAWAHVAHLFKTPWVAIRSISDQADGMAPGNFIKFLTEAVANMSELIQHLLPVI